MNPKQAAQQIFEMINSGDLSRIREVLAEEFVDHGSPLGDVVGPDAFAALVRTVRDGLSEYRYDADLLVAEGDLVAWRATAQGVHSATLFGAPATGRDVTIQSYNFARFRDGKAVEHWGLIDRTALMQQLGAVA